MIDKRIINFITEHHVLTLATCTNNTPYCANCFYIYLEKENLLAFTSDKDTKHITDAIENSKIAGSIVLETGVIGKIQGVQFNGNIFEAKNEDLKTITKAYLKKFPVARLMDTTFWAVDINYIKMTHNILGFGKKLIWKK